MKRCGLIILVAALLLVLCACDLQNRRPSSEFIPQTQPPATTEPPATEPEPTQAETAAEQLVIREAFVKKGSYTDQYGIRYEYSYRLPYIDCATSFALGCNEKIETQFRKPLEKQLAAMDAGDPLTILTADYDTRLRGDLLTLYLTLTPTQGEAIRAVFTIHQATGEAVSGAELLDAAKLTEERFSELAEQAIREAFEAEYGTAADDLRYNGALDRTLAEENYGTEMPMYLDETDRLVILATIYDLAGGTHIAPLPLEP